MGQRLARSLLETDVVDRLSLGKDAAVIYWTADDRVLGRTVRQCRFRQEWQVGVVGVRHAGGESLEMLPDPDYVFQPGDVLLLAVTDARLTAFTRRD